jgi:hypothetical protein
MPGGAQNSVDSPAQIVLSPVMSQVGKSFTVSVLVQVLEQPLALVMVTVYVPAVLIDPVHCVVAVKPPGPVHEYELMPAGAQNSVDPPVQIVLLPVMSQVGKSSTVSVLVQVLEQPLASVIVTVYVPAALIDPVHCVVAVKPPGPVHEYELMPAGAQNSVDPPLQISSSPVILQVGGLLTVTVPQPGCELHPFELVTVTQYCPAADTVIDDVVTPDSVNVKPPGPVQLNV